MINAADMAHCRDVIRTGSLSFHAASKLLPSRVRDPALALYAFCRLADDAVDETLDKAPAVLSLEKRLDLVYRGTPRNAPEDRAMAAIVEEFDMPKALPEALLEGLAWDANGNRYTDLSAVRSYSARVAAAVGAMMCVLMRVRDPHTLSRACDLGVAMQLTNIARDVGEDARAGRIYLPTQWFDEAKLDLDEWLAAPTPLPEVRKMVKRLLAEAHRLYTRSEAGIAGLPADTRMGIWAARLIYDAIGAEVQRNRYDSVTSRARTTKIQKATRLAGATGRGAISRIVPTSPVIYAPVLEECQFLVDATAHPVAQAGWGDGLLTALTQLKRVDLERRTATAAE